MPNVFRRLYPGSGVSSPRRRRAKAPTSPEREAGQKSGNVVYSPGHEPPSPEKFLAQHVSREALDNSRRGRSSQQESSLVKSMGAPQPKALFQKPGADLIP